MTDLREAMRNPFLRGYLNAALFAETDAEGEPLDKNYGVRDFSKDALEEMFADATGFLSENWDDIAGDPERAGQDFWFTRNGHGAGFWDGDWPEPAATRLTDAAHAYGEVYLYVGDDGMIYSG